MSSNTINPSPYLRSSWDFPQEDLKQVVKELTRSYISIAQNINVRTIGLFPTNRPAITGEAYYITSAKQQAFRQIYPFTATGNIIHGINFNEINSITACTGSFTDGTNWYGTIFGGSVAIAGQVSFYLTPTNIVIEAGAGSPGITKGLIVLSWIANP